MVRTARIVLVVAALGTASLMWGLGGLGDLYGETNPVGDLQSGDEVERQADESAVVDNGSFSGSASRSDDSIVGLIVSGASAITDFAAMVALLPLELQRLGLPRYAAYPLGLIAQAVVGIGVVQFATGREWR
jgi:hypothetical protein